MLFRTFMFVLLVAAASGEIAASDIHQLRIALISDAVATPANTQEIALPAAHSSPAIAQIFSLSYYINDQNLTILEGTMLTAAAEGLLRDREAIKLRQLRNPIRVSERQLRAIISTAPKSALDAPSDSLQDKR